MSTYVVLLRYFPPIFTRTLCPIVKMPERTLDLFMTVSSCLSICGCMVIFFCHFQLDKVQRKKAYNKIIFFVVVSDFFSAIGTAFGIEKDNTVQCALQAFLTIAFPLCSIFWTTVSFYLFYLAIRNRQSSKHVMIYLHLICWGLPILLTLLPLTVGLEYGVKEGSDHEWCSLSNPNDIPGWELTFWTFASFYFWVWLSVGGYSILITIIFYELNSRVFFTSDDTNARLRPIVKKMIFLPMVIIFCWTIPTCYRVYFYIHNENVYILQLLSAVSAALKGFFTSLLLIVTKTVEINFSTVKKECKTLTQFRHSDLSNLVGHDASENFRNSSTSGVSQVSSSTLHDDILPGSHHIHIDPPETTSHVHHVNQEENEVDEDVDDDYDYERFLFRVPNDHERMSQVSSDSDSVSLRAGL